MKAMQIVLDKNSSEQAAQYTDTREAQDREGYLKQPQSSAESRLWEAETSWPKE